MMSVRFPQRHLLQQTSRLLPVARGWTLRRHHHRYNASTKHGLVMQPSQSQFLVLADLAPGQIRGERLPLSITLPTGRAAVFHTLGDLARFPGPPEGEQNRLPLKLFA